ncbi:MAG TPA: sigma-70 family RNA polymerase sigma factor [Gemmatimonadota bacterium]|nr:sigma-70 family RNA polymerase sigma factor [Gemmatimonadota bacterium]
MTPSDEELVVAYLAALDEDAFRDLYQRHTPSLWRVALRMARGAEEEARDVVQETWLRAVRRLPAFRWESTLRTWLVSIALNCAHEHRRSAGRWTPVEDVESVMAGGSSVESETTGGPASVDPVDLARAIDALPEGYRSVLVLHDIEGYTHAEIGRALGIEPGTSKSQLHRARAWVRGRLATMEGGG